MKERLRFAAAALIALLIIVSLTASGWALMSRFQEGNQTRKNINAANQAQTEALRTVLCLARASIPANIDPAVRVKAYRFYAHALRLIHARQCDTLTKGKL